MKYGVKAVSAVVVWCGLFAESTALADILIVPDAYPTIQSAVDAAADGDTIRVRAGVYTEMVRFNEGGQHAGWSLTLEGDAAGERPVIDGEYQRNCIDTHPTPDDQPMASLVISNLDFVRGYWGHADSRDAAVYLRAIDNLLVTDCMISKCGYMNPNYLHIALYVRACPDAIIQSVDIIGNAASHALYLYHSDRSEVFDCQVKGNASTRYNDGTGVYVNNSTQVAIRNCLIADNIASDDSTVQGANGIYGPHYPFYLDNTIVCGNSGRDTDTGVVDTTQVTGAWIGSGNVISSNCGEGGGSIGACCLTTDCVETDAYECGVAGGVFRGALTTCDQIDCSDEGNVGACCIGGLCAPTNEYVCSSLGGQWAGEYTTCADTQCTPPPAIAACCISDSCMTTTEELCGLMGGLWQGDKSDCSAAECEPWVGACCVNGACSQVTLANCAELGGTYFGDLSPCDDLECPGTCLGDLNGDDQVSVDDILILISGFGPCM
jgi:hypothetical protein